jgi:hypothetical protein
MTCRVDVRTDVRFLYDLSTTHRNSPFIFSENSLENQNKCNSSNAHQEQNFRCNLFDSVHVKVLFVPEI